MSIRILIRTIEELCFNLKDYETINHGKFKADFINYLQKKGCSVIEEYGLRFNNVTRNGEIVERGGAIDFMVAFDDNKIAIEFDNGNRLKLKSIAKLLQSGADVLIGIVRGNQSYSVLSTNRSRIIYVVKKLQISRSILLIIISQKSYNWIKPFG